MANPRGNAPAAVTQAAAKKPAARTDSDNHLLHMWNTNQWNTYTQQNAAKPGTPATPAQTQADVDKQSAQRDAGTVLTDLFTQYGLGSLAPVIMGYIKQGYSADAISVLLQGTPEYKQRFAANDIRVKNGLNALSPAEYIATERSYRQIMSAAGLPVGFYDSNSDFTSFIAKDVSPTELKQRVDTATDAVNKAPASTVDYFKQWYNTGDLIAYALDPAKAEPLIEQRVKAAEAAGVGQTQGIQLSQQNAELIGAQGNTFDQIQQGVGFIGGEQKTTDKLNQIYGGNVTQDDLVKEVFQNDAAAAQKRKTLASAERANFNGSGGASGDALKSNTGGAL